jgi:membrane protease YdiL (CAAX protease family)
VNSESLIDGSVAWRERRLQRPILGAMVVGVGGGVICALILTVSMLLIFRLIPESMRGGSAAAYLANISGGWVFFVAVIFSPLFETLLGQVLPIELARRLGLGATACVLISACSFSLGHVATGAGPGHALGTFIGGLVFASCYAWVRTAGWCSSYVATATAHATSNFLLIYLVGALLPE